MERRVLGTERDMSRVREFVVLFLCFLAEAGMVFQFIKPNYFFSSSMIIAGTTFTIARAIILVNMLGMFIFAVAVYRGNIKGRLHISYFIMMLYTVAMLVFAIAPRQYQVALENERLEMNSLLYLVTMLLLMFVFAVFILREKGAIRLMPKFSSVMLLVVIGQFVTNGLFINKGELISGPIYLLFGLIAAMPYIAIFVFEQFILEPTMIKYR